MNEGAPDPSIPIHKGVNRLKLGMNESGLDGGRVRCSVRVVNEIRKECLDAFWCWRNKIRIERRVGVPSDPILHSSKTTDFWRISEEGLLKVHKVFRVDSRLSDECSAGLFDDRHVVDDKTRLV